MLDKFLRTQSDFAARFDVARDSHDADATTRFAHTLKGVAANIGANDVRAAAAELENACAAGTTAEEIDRVLGHVTASLAPGLASIGRLNGGAPAETTASSNPDQLSARLSRLRELLEDDDAESAELLDALAADRRLDPQRAELERLAESLDEFDFEQALQRLTSLEQLVETSR